MLSTLNTFKEFQFHSQSILHEESNSNNSSIRNRLLLKFINFRKVLLKEGAILQSSKTSRYPIHMKRVCRLLQTLQEFQCREKRNSTSFIYPASTHMCMLPVSPELFQSFQTSTVFHPIPASSIQNAYSTILPDQLVSRKLHMSTS